MSRKKSPSRLPGNRTETAEDPAPAVRQNSSVEFRRTTISAFQGPLPPPEMLAKYNDCVPNGAERILALAESQARHRQELESTVIRGNVAAERRGQAYAFLLGLLAIGGGFALIATGKDGYGIAAIVTAFAALAGTFLYGRHQQEKERERKRQEAREAQQQPRLPYDS